MDKLVCSCGYTWRYKGKLSLATCPNCSKKVKNIIENECKT